MDIEINLKTDNELASLREEQQAVQFLIDSNNKDQQSQQIELIENQQTDLAENQQIEQSNNQQIEQFNNQQIEQSDNQQTEQLISLAEDKRSVQSTEYSTNDQQFLKIKSTDYQMVKTTISELPKLISTSAIHSLQSNLSITPQLPKLISSTKLKQSRLDNLSSSKIIYDSIKDNEIDNNSINDKEIDNSINDKEIDNNSMNNFNNQTILDEKEINNLLNNNNFSENSTIINCDNNINDNKTTDTNKTMFSTENDMNLLDNYNANFFFNNYNLANERPAINNNLVYEEERLLNNSGITQWQNNHHENNDTSSVNQSTSNLDPWFYLDKNILRYDETDAILNDCIQSFDTNTDQNFMMNNNFENLLRDDLIEEEDHKPTAIELSNYSNQYNLNQQYLNHHHYASNNNGLNNSSINQYSGYNSLDYHQLQSLTINSNTQTPYNFSATTNTTYSNGSTNLLPTSHYHLSSNINNSNGLFSNCNEQHDHFTVDTQNNYSKQTIVNAGDLMNKSRSINSTVNQISKLEHPIDDKSLIKKIKEEPINQLSLSTNSQNSDNSLNINTSNLSTVTRKSISIEKKIITLQEAANLRLEKIKLERSNGMKIYYFKCSLCTYQTNTSQSMKDHLYCIHCKAKNNYKCNICQQTFGWKNNAQRHMRRKHKIEDQTTKREAIVTLIK